MTDWKSLSYVCSLPPPFLLSATLTSGRTDLEVGRGGGGGIPGSLLLHGGVADLRAVRVVARREALEGQGEGAGEGAVWVNGFCMDQVA